MSGEAASVENAAQDASEPEDAVQALSRIEQALERIGQLAQSARPDNILDLNVAAGSDTGDIVGRLDELIAKLRGALAERPRQD